MSGADTTVEAAPKGAYLKKKRLFSRVRCGNITQKIGIYWRLGLAGENLVVL
jgi:hypothetical protein